MEIEIQKFAQKYFFGFSKLKIKWNEKKKLKFSSTEDDPLPNSIICLEKSHRVILHKMNGLKEKYFRQLLNRFIFSARSIIIIFTGIKKSYKEILYAYLFRKTYSTSSLTYWEEHHWEKIMREKMKSRSYLNAGVYFYMNMKKIA